MGKKNRIEKVAELFGLKIGERFKIKGKEDNTYWFTKQWGLVWSADEGVLDHNFEPTAFALHKLIMGEYEIERKCGLNE